MAGFAATDSYVILVRVAHADVPSDIFAVRNAYTESHGLTFFDARNVYTESHDLTLFDVYASGLCGDL
jgi:hypothetical protein